MSTWRGWIWERYKINCDMANNAFFIKDITNRFTNCHHIHVRKRLLWEEAASINVSFRRESIHRSNNFNLTIWLDHESDTWGSHLMAQTSWGRFYNSSNSAISRHIFVPAFEQRRHSNNRFLWEILGQYWLDALNQINIWIQLLFLKSLQRLDVVNVKVSMPSSIELIVNFEDPSCNIQILRDQRSQRTDEFCLIINIDAADGGWNVSQLEDLFRTRFSGV